MSYISNFPGGKAIDFSGPGGNVDGIRMESKYCESCRGMYFRRQTKTGKDSPRGLCGRCIRAEQRRMEKEVAELRLARSLGDPKKMMPQ